MNNDSENQSAHITVESRIEYRRLAIIAAMLIISGIILYFGWKLLWFLTDDAHIAFRYISNSMLGYGYVWNEPPFRPVEGYTSFLWIVILEAIWRLFGIMPPESSNNISLALSYGTLIIAAICVMRMKLSDSLKNYRLLFLGLILFAIVTNSTFLTWTSSGLETALFNFLFATWVYFSFFAKDKSRFWIFGIGLTASLLYLTRPDGILYVLATYALIALQFIKDYGQGKSKRINLLYLLPLIIPFIFLGWRLSFYGEWLPNTYYAKHVAPWPLAGIRYLASFILEYSLWIWLLLFLAVIYAKVKAKNKNKAKTRQISAAISKNRLINFLTDKEVVLNKFVALAAILLHFGYYTLIIGGDHFEWRVYSNLIPWVFISFLWMLSELKLKAGHGLLLLSAFILLSLPISWRLWYLTKDLNSRDETLHMEVPVSDGLPGAIKWYTQAFDKMQFWLIDHSICMRRQEHTVFFHHQSAYYPTRESGSTLNPGGYPVMHEPCVGVPAWVFPYVNIIDDLGLNDYFVARSRPVEGEERQMAHDRRPPFGYIESFQPNYGMHGARAVLHLERAFPFTAEYIRRLERYWELKILDSIDVLDSNFNQDSISYYINQQ